MNVENYLSGENFFCCSTASKFSENQLENVVELPDFIVRIFERKNSLNMFSRTAELMHANTLQSIRHQWNRYKVHSRAFIAAKMYQFHLKIYKTTISFLRDDFIAENERACFEGFDIRKIAYTKHMRTSTTENRHLCVCVCGFYVHLFNAIGFRYLRFRWKEVGFFSPRI